MTVVDQDTRDRAVVGIEASMALSAGAGSGKTSVLTQRVIELLVRGVGPDRIAAITFTEKAAAELQARVRDALEARMAAEPTSGPKLDAVLGRLPELTLSTIHSFCRRLLNMEALEAQWAPDTEVLSEIFQAAEVGAALEAWKADFLRRHPLGGLLLHQRLSTFALRSGATLLLSTRDVLPIVDASPFDASRAHTELLAVIDAIERAAAGCRNPAQDKLLANNRPLRELLRSVVGLEPGDAVVRMLASGVNGSKTGGKKTDWVDGGKSMFVEACSSFAAWSARQRVSLHALVVGDLHRNFLPTAQRAKASAAVADFDDLLFRAAELLGRSKVRSRLAERFDALLIDEVQDTDPIQAEVATLLTREPAHEGPWDRHAPRPGRLFAVGDPRQSIYRFRRADVETWGTLQALVARDGEALSLRQNFRSVPGIVEWVNATFEPMDGYQPQVAHRAPAALEPVVSLPVDDDDDDAEVHAVVRHLLSLRDTGRIVGRDDGVLRSVEWSDVMILLPAWSKSELIRATLSRAGIPSVVEGGRYFFHRDEVRLCMAALRCLEDSSEERSTVFVLRGLFGIDWNTLARHRAEGGTWRYTVPNPPEGPVADAFDGLRRLARQRGRQSWVALLDELLHSSRAAAVWAALADGDARLSNLDKLRALIRQIEQGARSSRAVITGLAELAKEDDKDLSRVDVGSEAVRITSYHKAKGLESPVVVLCFASRKAAAVSSVVDRSARKVALKIGELVPPDWQTHHDREKAALAEERRRWMYVAATRARDQLVVVDRQGHELVREHLAAGLGRARRVATHTLPEPVWIDETFPGHDAQVDAWLEDPTLDEDGPETDPSTSWAADRRTAVGNARSASVRWRSVQEISSRERVAEASSPVGVRGGVLVHEVMEALDLGRPAQELRIEAEALARSLAVDHGIDDEQTEACASIVLGLLRHPVVERARRAPERWTEVPFSIRDGGRIVSGRIDLAFPTDETRRSWVVVDWKSDLPTAGTPAARNYQRQLGLYAKALLRTVSPCEEVETVLVGPHPALGAPGNPAWTLAGTLHELGPVLSALLNRGVEPPRVGAEIGDSPVIRVELAWNDRRVALCVGQPEHEVAALRDSGWTVVTAEPVGLTWAEECSTELARVLGHYVPEAS